MIIKVENLIADFLKVAKLSGFSISRNDIDHELKSAHHSRPNLPDGLQAVYVFSIMEPQPRFLKVGKAGPKTKARFNAQHYNPKSCPSNLAKSLLGDDKIWNELNTQRPIDEHIGIWIQKNTDRDHFYLAADCDSYLLSLLEIFLQCRLHPLYEG